MDRHRNIIFHSILKTIAVEKIESSDKCTLSNLDGIIKFSFFHEYAVEMTLLFMKERKKRLHMFHERRSTVKLNNKNVCSIFSLKWTFISYINTCFSFYSNGRFYNKIIWKQNANSQSLRNWIFQILELDVWLYSAIMINK